MNDRRFCAQNAPTRPPICGNTEGGNLLLISRLKVRFLHGPPGQRRGTARAAVPLNCFQGSLRRLGRVPTLASILLNWDSEESMVLSHVGSLPSPWPHRLTRLGRWGSSFALPHRLRHLTRRDRRGRARHLVLHASPRLAEREALICPAGWCIL